jgi:hypothetical protein
MTFASDRQRKAFFFKLNSPYSSVKFSSFPSDNVLSSPPSYVYDKEPVDQFSERSDLEGILKSLKRLEDDAIDPKVRDKIAERRLSLENNVARLNFDEKGGLILPPMDDESAVIHEALRQRSKQVEKEYDEQV